MQAERDAALNQLSVERALANLSAAGCTNELDGRHNEIIINDCLDQILTMESLVDSRVQHLVEERARVNVQQQRLRRVAVGLLTGRSAVWLQREVLALRVLCWHLKASSANSQNERKSSVILCQK